MKQDFAEQDVVQEDVVKVYEHSNNAQQHFHHVF